MSSLDLDSPPKKKTLKNFSYNSGSLKNNFIKTTKQQKKNSYKFQNGYKRKFVKISGSKKKMNIIKKQFDEINNEKSKFKEQVNYLNKHFYELKNKNSILKKQVNDLNEKLDEINYENSILKKQVNDLIEKLDEINYEKQLKEQIDEIKKEISKLKQQNEQNDKNINEIKFDLWNEKRKRILIISKMFPKDSNIQKSDIINAFSFLKVKVNEWNIDLWYFLEDQKNSSLYILFYSATIRQNIYNEWLEEKLKNSKKNIKEQGISISELLNEEESENLKKAEIKKKNGLIKECCSINGLIHFLSKEGEKWELMKEEANKGIIFRIIQSLFKN